MGRLGRLGDTFYFGSPLGIIVSLALALVGTWFFAPTFWLLQFPRDTMFLVQALVLLSLSWLLPIGGLAQFVRNSRTSSRKDRIDVVPRPVEPPLARAASHELAHGVLNLPIRMIDSEFRRHHLRLTRVILAFSAIPWAIALSVTTFLLLQPGLAAQPALITVTLPMWGVAIWFMVRYVRVIRHDRPFEMDEHGITPRPLPIEFIRIGKLQASYQEIAKCVIFKTRRTWSAGIELKDGSSLTLSERDGVPRSAFEALAVLVPSRVIDLDDVGKGSESGTRLNSP